MADPTIDEIEDLRKRVLRIEAIEASRARFNEYPYSLDGGHPEDLRGLFAADARPEPDLIGFDETGHTIRLWPHLAAGALRRRR